MERVITGKNASGRSDVLESGKPQRVWTWTMSPDNAPYTQQRNLVPGDTGPAAARSGQVREVWTMRAADGEFKHENPDGNTEPPDIMSLDCPPGVMRWIRTEFGPGYKSKMHFTDSLDLTVVIEGEIDLILEDRTVHLTVGDSVVLPGLQHCWSTDDGAAVIHWMFSPAPA